MKKLKTAIEYDYIVHSIGTKEEPAYEAIIPTLSAVVYGENAAELESGILQVIDAQRRRLKAMPKPDTKKKNIGKRFAIQMKSRFQEKLTA